MFTVAEIAAATGGVIHGNREREVAAVSTDSRSVQPGALFVPLKGERFDGHDFLPEVFGRGVTVTLAESGHSLARSGEEGRTIIAVPDTLKALGDLAAAFRRRFALTVIGVTGSNGKTTTKEMLAAILEQTGSGLKTQGNLNNLIGLPQMLFRLETGHRWAVLEMGMSEPGEIDRLAEIAGPQIGIVLNAFPAHLESMGSVENVARAKGELLLRLPHDGCAVVNGDDPLIAVQPSPAGVRRLVFGSGSQVHATEIEPLGIVGQRFLLHIEQAVYPVVLHAFGGHAVSNALAAAAASLAAGVSPELIVSGLERFRPYDKRFRLEEVGGLVLIDDSYNANPASTEAALNTLAGLKGSRRAFVALGDMLELGGDEAELHRQAGIQAARVADRLYLLGDLTRHSAEGASSAGMPAADIVRAANHEEIIADIRLRAAEGDFILVKGSRGMRMERVAEGIRDINR
ncbi:UDP-N-acetylmuramoyl-tripeptide--D-alanyl-D-alanine ligase [Geobacter sp. SVR]|uniref:UDP-N-acetylmuramoyl-tripeptide--D-alanyl-D- alanine ligase n=1 Tax=Geobacter sp. SVR TaxID=2495594 RepID=UPI00143EF8AA|nr:UDP-N-acetylmuramoyl-tripeptide--D-alanyl-D-alanine ligase [Geobacter sp. SVR]BCS52291.1 UDP-N-acetylmuramoyl-tripeptide--D-alanyl-D-alanine ligase [Geobacter sp. SVR]GCF85050.1 UDP-N-acetylmuramoyl-tripeptide--D-alanyl-D-alanine ligase [Geobacter sp. SVR]